jgi:class 3 adenylate cyclase
MMMRFHPYARHWVVPGLLDWLGRILASLALQMTALWGYRRAKTQCATSQQVSILFTDIVSFSRLMATGPLEETVSSLNDYFERLSRCVDRHRGQVDKFIGDGMMAVFESPDDAVRAAQAIQQEVARYNLQQHKQKRCRFPTRIVVDTGVVVKTAIGLHRNRDRTVLGMVVNTASHLARILPPDRVFISHSTRRQLSDQSSWCLTQPQTIDGCHGELVVYEVTG